MINKLSNMSLNKTYIIIGRDFAFLSFSLHFSSVSGEEFCPSQLLRWLTFIGRCIRQTNHHLHCFFWCYFLCCLIVSFLFLVTPGKPGEENLW